MGLSYLCYLAAFHWYPTWGVLVFKRLFLAELRLTHDWSVIYLISNLLCHGNSFAMLAGYTLALLDSFLLLLGGFEHQTGFFGLPLHQG